MTQQLRAERDTLATKIELDEHRRSVQEMMAMKDGQVGLIEQRVTQLEQEDSYSRGGHMSGTLFHCLILLHIMNIVLLHLLTKLNTKSDRLHMMNKDAICLSKNVSLVFSQI